MNNVYRASCLLGALEIGLFCYLS